MTTFGVILLGVGLAVDASCVCATNGLVYRPSHIKSLVIALPFAIFQGIMPIIGYFCVGFLPYNILRHNHIIAFVLLFLVGAKMLFEGVSSTKDEKKHENTAYLSIKTMLIQGISTSIDALSVGVTLGGMGGEFLFYSVVLISFITFVMCFTAVRIGEKIGTRLNNKAEVIGGVVLIIIGIRMLAV